MKRSTAISRLTDIADGLDRAVQWSEVTVVGAYVFGRLLESDAQVERIELALVVAESPEIVPWMARPARLEALAETLRLPKLPVSWWWPRGLAGLEPLDQSRGALLERRWWSRSTRARRISRRPARERRRPSTREPWRARRAAVDRTRRRTAASRDGNRVLLRPGLASRAPWWWQLPGERPLGRHVRVPRTGRHPPAPQSLIRAPRKCARAGIGVERLVKRVGSGRWRSVLGASN
jgi:hypothetical protein